MKRKAISCKISTSKVISKKEQENQIELPAFIKNIEKKRNKYFMSSYSFNNKRIKCITNVNESIINKKNVLYWMSRDQRVQDNWAFIYAQKLSLKFKTNLHVCFCLVPKFLDANIRHYEFMLKGLEEVEYECRQLNINFHLLMGLAKDCIPGLVGSNNIGAVISDFSPLRISRQWIKELSENLSQNVLLCQVDAHNVVPVWEASPKMEIAARTIRTKINKQLKEYLLEFPPIIKHPIQDELTKAVDWISARQSIEVDISVKEVTCFTPGTKAGIKKLWEFLFSQKLVLFNKNRNNPTENCLSNLSPWLHFGQISAQRCIIEAFTQKHRANEGVDIFVEECLVRRELSDNFCYYNENYDNISGAADWAIRTLEVHRKDKRPYSYTLDQLDSGRTHDKLWNAAQLQMVRDGKMHGFLRMYWAKKILEWTDEGPEEALKRTIWLNDRYSLDGRDPNGYVGIMWSICGIHDQGWKERNIFGKIRYMNYAGCQRKFDVKQFESLYK